MFSMLLGVALATAMPQAAPAQAAGSIAGLVQDADTRVPVPEARVLITGPGIREATTTDNTGRFTFTSLAPGVYRVAIEKETFAFDVLRLPGVKVDAGATASVIFDLQRAGVILGDVRDDRGNPRSGVPVTAIRKIEGGTSTLPGTQRTTNDLGEFRLDGLLAGEYVVLASPPSARVTTGALMPTYRLTPLRPPTPNGILTEIEISAAAVKGNNSTLKVDVRNANVSGATIVFRPPQ